jgi:hypothetical protein
LGEFFHCSPFSFDDSDYFEFSYIFQKQQDVIEERNRQQELQSSGQQDMSALF